MDQSWTLLTTAQAAEQLGVSTDAVIRYFHSGILSGQRHGKRILVQQRAVWSLLKVMEWCRAGKPTPPARKPSTSAQQERGEDAAPAIAIHEPGGAAEAI